MGSRVEILTKFLAQAGCGDADKGEGEIRADTMLCEISDKRIEARFWFLVNIKNIENLLISGPITNE